MVGTMENERIASAMVGHAWEFNTKRSFEKWRNRALDVQSYNYNPELDHDVRETQKHYLAAENNLGSWDVDKTTTHMGYDYYEYQADRNKQAAEEKAEKAAALAAAAKDDTNTDAEKEKAADAAAAGEQKAAADAAAAKEQADAEGVPAKA